MSKQMTDSVMLHTATGEGVEAEEIAEKKLHRLQGPASRWPFSVMGERMRHPSPDVRLAPIDRHLRARGDTTGNSPLATA
jgi:hypothetical protein